MKPRVILYLLLASCGTRPQTPVESPAPPITNPSIAPTSAETELLRQIFAGCGSIRASEKPFPHFVIFATDGTLLGFQVYSDAAGTTMQGYGGPIPLRIFFDSSGKVLGFDVLPNNETPSYLAMCVDSLKRRLRNYSPGETKPVDAVTFATLSSNAIIQSVTATADRVAKEIVKPNKD